MAFIGIGDSIMRGYNSTLNGVPALSWGQWLAEANEWPSLILAKGGYTTAEIAENLLPKVAGSWEVAALSAGTNDALRPTWDAERFAAEHDALVEALAARSDRLLVLNVPANLYGVDKARVDAANKIIADNTERHGGILVDLSGLAGNVRMRPDLIHPSAVGHHEIANLAALALGGDVRGADTLGIGSPLSRLSPAASVTYVTRWAKLRSKAALKVALGR